MHCTTTGVIVVAPSGQLYCHHLQAFKTFDCQLHTNRWCAAQHRCCAGHPTDSPSQHVVAVGVRSLAFSYDPEACTEANMHSQQVSSFEEAVATATEWVSAPGFIWTSDQVVDRLAHKESNAGPST